MDVARQRAQRSCAACRRSRRRCRRASARARRRVRARGSVPRRRYRRPRGRTRRPDTSRRAAPPAGCASRDRTNCPMSPSRHRQQRIVDDQDWKRPRRSPLWRPQGHSRNRCAAAHATCARGHARKTAGSVRKNVRTVQTNPRAPAATAPGAAKSIAMFGLRCADGGRWRAVRRRQANADRAVAALPLCAVERGIGFVDEHVVGRRHVPARRAPPTLAVTGTLVPCTSIGVSAIAAADLFRDAHRVFEAAYTAAAGRIPRRRNARRCPASAPSRRRARAITRNTVSPTPWPNWSLMFLKWSRSNSSSDISPP